MVDPAWLLALLASLARRGLAQAQPQAQTTGDPAPLAPAVESEGPRLGDFAVSGFLELGYRFVDVHGSDAQFQEDLRLGSGVVLRALRFEGERAAGEGPVEAYSLEVAGVGDPYSSLGGTLDLGGWDAAVEHRRTRFEATTDTDIHAIDLDRDSTTLRLEHAPSGSTRAHGWIRANRHDYERVGGGDRIVGFFSSVGDFPVRRHGDELRLDALWGGRAGGFDWELEGGLSSVASRGRTVFSETLPAFPDDPLSEESDEDLSGSGSTIGAHVRRALDDGRVVLAAGYRRGANRIDGDLAVDKLGFLGSPASPLAETVRARSTFRTTDADAWVDLTLELAPGASLAFRYTRSDGREDGSVSTIRTIDDLSGFPPTVSEIRETALLESALDLFEVETDVDLSEHVGASLALQYGHEELELEHAIDFVFRSFDGPLDEWGVRAGVDLQAGAHEAHLSGGLAWEPTRDPGASVIYVIEDLRTRFVDLLWRFHPSDLATLLAEGRHEDQDSAAVTGTARDDRATLALELQPVQGLRAALSASYRELDLTTDLLSVGPVTGTLQTYESYEHSYTASLGLDEAGPFRPRLSASYVDVSGDSPLSYAIGDLDLPWAWSPRVTVGVEVTYTQLAAAEILDASDYDAWTATVYVRTTL